MTILNDFRLDGKKVFKWNESREAFLFVGTLGKRTLLQFIEDHSELAVRGL